MELDITQLFQDGEACEFSASIAERGPNAGPETWANALAEGASRPLLTTPRQMKAAREYFAELTTVPPRRSDRCDILGWTRDHLADRLECDARLLRRWEGHGFPPVVMDWLQRRARALEEDPAPDWQTWRAEE